MIGLYFCLFLKMTIYSLFDLINESKFSSATIAGNKERSVGEKSDFSLKWSKESSLARKTLRTYLNILKFCHLSLFGYS